MKKDKEKIYSANAAAERLGVSPATVVRYIKKGDIKATFLFGQWRIRESDLKPFLDVLE